MPSVSTLMTTSRKQFTGKNDYYGDTFLSRVPPNSIMEALAGVAPYDITGSTITNAMRDASIARLNRYRLGWNFYRGHHWDNEWEDGEKKPVINFCKKIVDAAVDWFSADGWSVSSPSGNEEIAELLEACWNYNNRATLTERLCQYGAITGDSFVYVTLETKDRDGNDLPPEERRVRIIALDPAYCYPVWNPLNPGEMLSILIQFPVVQEGAAQAHSLFSLHITPDKFQTWVDADVKTDEVNPFGMINVVHIPNFLLSTSVYGQSDIHNITNINEEYNLVMNSVRKIIKYHAEPTTLIFGAKASELDRGAKKVWSNLPIDAKVENLVLDSNLDATYTYMDRLERHMRDLSSTPKVAFDHEGMRLSNTSGLAMQMTFQPLIEKTKKRRINWKKGLQTANRLILIGHELLGINIHELADDPESIYITDVEFTSPLPRDEQAELDAAAKKIELGIWSQAEAIRRLGGNSDHRRAVLELLSDARYQLSMAFETQRANSGQIPNLSVVFLSSCALSEDFSDLQSQAQALEENSITTNVPPPPPAPIVAAPRPAAAR